MLPVERSGEEGSEVVEFCLVLVPLLGFVFLILNVAWIIFAQATIQHAVREGVRYAVTGQTMSGMCLAQSVRTVVKQNAMGFLSGSTADSLISMQLYNPTNSQTTNVPAGGNIVVVNVSGLRVGPLAPLLVSSTPLSLSSSSSDVMESSPGGIPPCL